MNNLDINKIIDDAMEKKDRFVSVFISPLGTTVKVEPLESRDPRWIPHREHDIYSTNRYSFECSECRGWNKSATSYCPHCGEKLRMPIEADFKKEATDDGNA